MSLFLASLRRYLSLLWQALTSPILDRRRWYGHLLLLLLLPVFLSLQLLQWLLFLIDEVLFRGYRRVEVRQPLFVLGPPRSGTTHLHQVLSLDDNRTTFSAWECALGLSITARKLVYGVARIDRLLGRPLGRMLAWVEKRLLDNTGSVHPVSLNGPEEDFLVFMPLAQCFLLIVPFPRSDWLWRTVRLDDGRVSDRQRRRLLRWYRRCIQKHLYVHGSGRLFLSKNASFAGMSTALLEEFPDAGVLCCMRDPLKVIPSQLSSLGGGLNACGFTGMPDSLRDRLVDLLHHYYRNLWQTRQRYPDRFTVIHNRDLHHDLYASVIGALSRLGVSITDPFRERLREASGRSAGYRSAHRYTLAQFGLDHDELLARFGPVHERFLGVEGEGAGSLTLAPQPTRIMVFSDAIPQRNGVGAYYCDLIEQLQASGWSTGFAGPDESRRWPPSIGMPGDRTQQVCLPSMVRVTRQVRTLAPRLIISATPGPYGMLGRWWARQLGVPLLVGFHTDFPGVTAHYPTVWLRVFSRHYFQFADQRLFRDAECVLGNSEPMLTMAVERGARKTDLIGTLLPGGILRTESSPPRDHVQHVLFAGRLAPEKNVHTLIEAARALPWIRFTIAGDGPLYDEL
ncbi:MAG: sulfotransferase, partial [Pseudomonadota bacterium]